MATTHIDYKDDKGFWVAEIYIELTYEYILQALNNKTNQIPIEKNLRKDLELFTSGMFKGMLTLTWDTFLSSEDEQVIVSILEDTKTLLQNKGEYISKEELNSYEVKKGEMASVWPKPIKISEVIKIVDALILMFKGEWDETSYGMDIDYSFV